MKGKQKSFPFFIEIIWIIKNIVLYLYCQIKTTSIMKINSLVYFIETGERFLIRSNEKNGKIIVKDKVGKYKVAYVKSLKLV